MAEKYPGMSPYVYTMNNPVRYVDSLGLAPDDIILLNKKNKEIGRIVIANHKDEYYKVNTSYSTNDPLKVDLTKIQETVKDNVDAVSLNVTYAGLMGVVWI